MFRTNDPKNIKPHECHIRSTAFATDKRYQFVADKQIYALGIFLLPFQINIEANFHFMYPTKPHSNTTKNTISGNIKTNLLQGNEIHKLRYASKQTCKL